MGDAGCGMWAGSGCGSAQAPGKRQLVPAGSRGGSEMAAAVPPLPWGRGFCGFPLAGSWSWSSSVSAESAPGLEPHPCPWNGPGITVPCMRGTGDRKVGDPGVGIGEMPCQPSLCTSWCWPLSPTPSCRRMWSTGSPGLHESPHLPIAPLSGAESGCCRQKAASPPAQWLLSSPGCRNKGPFVGTRVPGGRVLESSPLRWAPASPPPGEVCPPPPWGEDGLARERGILGRGVRVGAVSEQCDGGSMPRRAGLMAGALLWGQKPPSMGWVGVGDNRCQFLPSVHLGALVMGGDAAPGWGTRLGTCVLGCGFSSGDAKWDVGTWRLHKATGNA